MIEVVAWVVARGGVLRVVDGRWMACRLAVGHSLPPEFAAIDTADWEATVLNIIELTETERAAYRATLVHDLTALVAAKRRLSESTAEVGSDE